MSGIEFFRTQMGHRFYEGTMPKIAEQLERLNDNLQALLVEVQKRRDGAPPTSTPAPDDRSKT
jgi:hypothetical protein